MHLATKTKDAINAALELDGGAKYRGFLREAMVDIDDAFNPEQEKTPRKHLGASLIGRECSRFLWLSWRWAFWAKPKARMVRLFNRGHLEEARWIALLRAAGMHTVHTENKGQIRVHGVGGHFGGSLDGAVYDCPDMPGLWGLLEFKTSNKNGFTKLQKVGVKEAKNEHYVQCQIYMQKKCLTFALYGCVCKDDDEIHLEIVYFDKICAGLYENRATKVITAVTPPAKCSASPLYQTCKWCDAYNICHSGAAIMRTCRSCEHVQVCDNGVWHCGHKGVSLSAEEQFAACPSYELARAFHNV